MLVSQMKSFAIWSVTSSLLWGLVAAQLQQNLEVPNQPSPTDDQLLPDTCNTAPLSLQAPLSNAIGVTTGGNDTMPRAPTTGEFEAELEATSNSTQHATPEQQVLMKINCKGSFWCPWFNIAAHQYLAYLLRMMVAELDDTARYFAKANIACAKLWDDERAFCLFPQGNVDAGGVDGKTAKLKVKQMIDFGCFACGSVPLVGVEPGTGGILTMNYVNKAICTAKKGKVVCDPSVAPASVEPGTVVANVETS